MKDVIEQLKDRRQPLKLMYITNRPDVAKIAEENTVDRIWVDLESRGKIERQGHVNSVKSNHTMADVSSIRAAISKAQLLVRVNPLWECSKAEIDEVISRGADIIMLPMFHTPDDAKQFIDLINGRAKVLLLAETIEAEKNIDAIASVPGVDEIHIGLNDLHLSTWTTSGTWQMSMRPMGTPFLSRKPARPGIRSPGVCMPSASTTRCVMLPLALRT